MKMRLLCCLALLSILFGFVSCAKVAPFELEIRFLDVGQGDAVLLRTSEGDVLVDAGSDASQEELCLRLEQIGVRELVLAVSCSTNSNFMCSWSRPTTLLVP